VPCFIVFTAADQKPLIIAIDTICAVWEDEDGDVLLAITGSQEAWKLRHTLGEVRNALEMSGGKVVRC